MIIHKQDVTLLEDILQLLQDYSNANIFEENYNDFELEHFKLSIARFELFKDRVKEEFLNT